MFLSLVMLPRLSLAITYDVEQAYQPRASIWGNLSIVGSDSLASLTAQWTTLFKFYYPAVNVQIQTSGSSTAVPALIEATAQFGTMSRAMRPRERDAFERKYGYPPTPIKVAIDALGVFVHQDNPLNSISIAELDAVFSSTLLCGGARAINKWGELGLDASWQQRDMQLIGRNSVSGSYGLFKDKALCGGDFRNNVNELPGSASVIQATANALNAIGYAGVGYQHSGAKMLPIRVKGRTVRPLPQEVLSGNYPLSRTLYIYVNKIPGKPLAALEAEFIKLIFSQQGQRLVAKEGFVPLPQAQLQAELLKLGLDK